MQTKVCPNPQCPHGGQPQPIDNFSRHKRNPDGRQSWCKACMRKTNARWGATPNGRASKAKYKRTDKGRATERRYQQSEHKKSIRKQKLLHDTSYRNRLRARTATNHAIRAGTLPRPDTLTCIECGCPASEYHHHRGYAEKHWLDVVPMCRPCHKMTDTRKQQSVLSKTRQNSM